MHSLLIQGWRFYPHSYAIINQHQCLELLRRKGLEIFFEDVPFVSDLKQVFGLLDPVDERALKELPAPPAGKTFDAVYRIAYPFDLGPSRGERTFVFGTAEYGVAPVDCVRGGGKFIDAFRKSPATMIATSNWARNGFLQSGAPADRVKVVPAGVDPKVLRPPTEAERLAWRRGSGVSDNFVFLHVGAMATNKNVPMIMEAFAAVAEKYPHARLAMKGLDAFYTSKQQLDKAFAGLSPAQRAIVEPRMFYFGDVFTEAALAQTYQTVDAYVSPYSAEGFNMPVLEAAACGVPIICTAGGSTDDFTASDFTLHVRANVAPIKVGGEMGQHLIVDPDHLKQQMLRAMEDNQFRGQARIAGPAFVARGFTWRAITDKLLDIMFPGVSFPHE